MGRIRSIKPGFFANEGLSTISEAAQLLAGGLLCYADDEGYFNANPGLIKAAVFPLREPSEPIPDMLRSLAQIKYARFGTGKDGKRYGHIINFTEHQRVSHPVPSKIKKMEIVWEDSVNPLEDSVSDTGSLLPELKGIEEELNGKGKVKNPPARKARGTFANNSQVAKATGQNRHERIHQMLMGWYRDWAGAECPWGPAEAGNLKKLLTSTPNWTDQQFVTCLDNLARSDCVPKGDSPHQWLMKLPKFLHGPLNEFWKPKHIPRDGNGNGSPKTAAAARTARNLEVLVPQRVGHGVSGVHVPDVGTVQPRTDGNGQRSDGRIANSEILAGKPPIIDA